MRAGCVVGGHLVSGCVHFWSPARAVFPPQYLKHLQDNRVAIDPVGFTVYVAMARELQADAGFLPLDSATQIHRETDLINSFGALVAEHSKRERAIDTYKDDTSFKLTFAYYRTLEDDGAPSNWVAYEDSKFWKVVKPQQIILCRCCLRYCTKPKRNVPYLQEHFDVSPVCAQYERENSRLWVAGAPFGQPDDLKFILQGIPRRSAQPDVQELASEIQKQHEERIRRYNSDKTNVPISTTSKTNGSDVRSSWLNGTASNGTSNVRRIQLNIAGQIPRSSHSSPVPGRLGTPRSPVSRPTRTPQAPPLLARTRAVTPTSNALVLKRPKVVPTAPITPASELLQNQIIREMKESVVEHTDLMLDAIDPGFSRELHSMPRIDSTVKSFTEHPVHKSTILPFLLLDCITDDLWNCADEIADSFRFVLSPDGPKITVFNDEDKFSLSLVIGFDPEKLWSATITLDTSAHEIPVPQGFSHFDCIKGSGFAWPRLCSTLLMYRAVVYTITERVSQKLDLPTRSGMVQLLDDCFKKMLCPGTKAEKAIDEKLCFHIARWKTK